MSIIVWRSGSQVTEKRTLFETQLSQQVHITLTRADGGLLPLSIQVCQAIPTSLDGCDGIADWRLRLAL